MAFLGRVVLVLRVVEGLANRARVSALREVSPSDVPALFLADAATQYPFAAGHCILDGESLDRAWLLDSLRARGVLGP